MITSFVIVKSQIYQTLFDRIKHWLC